MDEDILQAIPRDQLPHLLQRFDNDYGKHIYYFILNNKIWLEKDSTTKIHFFCINGKFQDDCTFVGISEEGMYQVIVFTYDKSCKSLTKCLLETKKIDWKRGPLFNYIHQDHCEAVEKVLNTKQLIIAARTYSTIWRFKSETQQKIEISVPDDVDLIELTENNAEVINDEWVYKMEGSLDYVKKLIKLNGGFGLVGKVDGQLRSWVLQYGSGGPGVLTTKKEHRGKGYAKIVTSALTNKLIDMKWDSIAYISQYNKTSQRVFQKLGYEIVANCNWLFLLDTVNYSNANLDWS